MGYGFFAKKYGNGIFVAETQGRGTTFGWYEDATPAQLRNAREISLQEARDLVRRWVGFCPQYRVEDGVIYRTMTFGSRCRWVDKGWSPYQPQSVRVVKSLGDGPKVDNGIIKFSIATEYHFADKGHDNVCSEKKEYTFECSKPRGISTSGAMNTAHTMSDGQHKVWIHLADEPGDETYCVARRTGEIVRVYKGRIGDTEYYEDEEHMDVVSEGKLEQIVSALETLPSELREEFSSIIAGVPKQREKLEEERAQVKLYWSDVKALQRRADELVQEALR